MDEFSSDSNSVSDYLSLEGSSIYNYDTDTCDTLIAEFEQCKVKEKKNLIPQHIGAQENINVTDFSSQSVSNSNDPTTTMNEKNSAAESFQERSLNNNYTHKKITHEVGVNTDRRFNCKVTNFRQPYFKYKKHVNQYHNFKRTFTHNGISKKQYKTSKNYRNCNQPHEFHNRWQFQKPKCREERIVRGFYFFTQLMKCFTGRF